MTRSVTVLKGLAALAALGGLVVGVPLLLVAVAGWPLPTKLPAPHAIGDALIHDGVPATTIVRAVAVVIWVAWAQLMLSVSIEIVGVVRHRRLARLAGLGPGRALAASLVTAAATLLGSLGPLRPVGAVAAPRTVATPPRRGVTADQSADTAKECSWTVRPRDTFWGIAEATLGRGERWREIERLNRGREVVTGVVLLPGTELLRPGWRLRLPPDAIVREAGMLPGSKTGSDGAAALQIAEPGAASHAHDEVVIAPSVGPAPAVMPDTSAVPEPVVVPVSAVVPDAAAVPVPAVVPDPSVRPAPAVAPVAEPAVEPVAAPVSEPVPPGRLAVPAAQLGQPLAVVRVLPGDTLSSIAARSYGDARQWPRLWEANRGRTFAGRQFLDPNVIHAGWVLDVPLVAEPAADVPPAHTGPARASARPRLVRDHAVRHDTTRATERSAEPEPSPPPGVAPTAVGEGTFAASTVVSSLVVGLTTAPVDAPPPAETTPAVATHPAGASSPAGDEPALTRQPAPTRQQAAVNPWAISTGVLSAALLATGVVGLVESRRRRRLEQAPARAVLPPLDPDLAPVERAARLGASPVAAARVDAALRALAAASAGHIPSPRPLAVRRSPSGDLSVTLAASMPPTAPWQPGRTEEAWVLPASVALADIVAAAGAVPSPCPALILLGVDETGELYVDLEALGTLVIDGPPEAARAIARAAAASLAVSPVADRVHVVAAGVDCYGFANEHLVQAVADAGAALDLAADLAAPLQRAMAAERLASSLALRAAVPGELWEPVVVVALASAAEPGDVAALAELAGSGGRGVALLTDVPVPGALWRLRLAESAWQLEPLASAVTPHGLAADELADLGALLRDASEPAVAPCGSAVVVRIEPFVEPRWDLLARVLGAVDVVDRTGDAACFGRSKALELVVWLAQHRAHPTRTGARTALWESDVRAATFANVVSDARRALARLVPPPDSEEWIGRTYAEELPLHPLVLTDAQLLEARLAHACSQADNEAAIATLRPGLALVRDLPYTATSYLWTDNEAWPSHLTLLVVNSAVELATRCLATGDADGAFWATAQGMKVLPGHDELVCLRLRAHAVQGNLAGLRHEFASYERGLTADPWGDGEPSPKVVATRNELLRTAVMGPAA